MPGSVLDVFKHLSSGSLDLATGAAVQILKNTPDFKNSKDGLSADCEYILMRLIRGMASAELKTKTGFFSLLVTLLRLHKGITLDHVFQILESKLEIGIHDSSREKSDVISARILVYGAIIRSGLFERCVEEQQEKILETLLSLSRRKSYFVPLTFSFLLDLIQKVDAAHFEHMYWPLLESYCNEEISKHCIESLSCILLSNKRFPEIVQARVDLSFLLNVETMPVIARKLAVIPMSETLKAFLNLLSEFISIKSNAEELLCAFWNDGIEKGFKAHFENNETPFLFVKHFMEHLKNPSLVLVFLSTHFVKAMTQDGASPIIKKFLLTFSNYIKNNAEKFNEKTLFNNLQALSEDPKNPFVDSKSGSQFFVTLAVLLKEKHAKKLAKSYQNVLHGLSEKTVNGRIVKTTWSSKTRLNAATILLKMSSFKSCSEDIDWQAKQLQCVLSTAVCKVSGKAAEDHFRDELKHLFYAALPKPTSANEHYKVLLVLAKFMDSEIKKGNLHTPLSSNEQPVWNAILEKSKSLEKKISKSDTDDLADIVCLSLSLQLAFLLFSKNSLAVEAIQKLNDYYDLLKAKSLVGSDMLDAFVSLLLDLLSLESVQVRQMVNKIFASISGQLKPDTLVRILKILDPEDDGELDEESSSSESEAEEPKAPSKSKKIKGKKQENGEEDEDEVEDKDDDSDTSDDDSMSEEEDGVNKETETDRLRQAMNAALGDNANYTDTESIDLDDLDEETGDLLDERLGQVFKLFRKPSRKKKKKVQSPEDRAVSHYRMRILDLLETIIDENPSLFAAVNILNTLVMLYESSKVDKLQEALSKRVVSCLKNIVNLKKFSNFADVEEAYLASTLEALLERHNILPNPGDYYCFIIRASQQLSKSGQNQGDDSFTTLSILKRAVKDFFTKKNSFYKMDMFLPILNLQWDGLLELIPNIATYAYSKDSGTVFKQASGCKMIDMFYKNNRMASQIPKNSLCSGQNSPKKKKKKGKMNA
nr:PREDICTED: uncharacterized protein LOC109044496 [Bemisia tabaci]